MTYQRVYQERLQRRRSRVNKTARMIWALLSRQRLWDRLR